MLEIAVSCVVDGVGRVVVLLAGHLVDLLAGFFHRAVAHVLVALHGVLAGGIEVLAGLFRAAIAGGKAEKPNGGGRDTNAFNIKIPPSGRDEVKWSAEGWRRAGQGSKSDQHGGAAIVSLGAVGLRETEVCDACEDDDLDYARRSRGARSAGLARGVACGAEAVARPAAEVCGCGCGGRCDPSPTGDAGLGALRAGPGAPCRHIPGLEDEMCGFGGAGAGERSDDRVDAMVWAVIVLLEKPQAAPGVVSLWGRRRPPD